MGQLDGLKAAYPYGPTAVLGSRCCLTHETSYGESLNEINSEGTAPFFKKLRELNDVDKGPQGRPVLSPQSGRANLLLTPQLSLLSKRDHC
jgi:hypothetical protein